MQPLIFTKEKQRRRLWGRLRVYGIIVCVIMLFEAFFYAVYYLPIFKIKTLEIIGLENLSAPVVLNNIASGTFDNYLTQFLGFDNFFSWPKSLANVGLVIKGVNFQKDFWENKLTINIQERKRYGLWCIKAQNSKCFWFDNEGIIFKPSANNEGNFPIIEKIDDGQALINNNLLGLQILPPEQFSYLKKILETIKENLSIKKLTWSEVEQDLIGELDSGLVLKFSLRFNPANNLEALKKIVQRKNFSKMFYIDLRIENKIYLK